MTFDLSHTHTHTHTHSSIDVSSSSGKVRTQELRPHAILETAHSEEMCQHILSWWSESRLESCPPRRKGRNVSYVLLHSFK